MRATPVARIQDRLAACKKPIARWRGLHKGRLNVWRRARRGPRVFRPGLTPTAWWPRQRGCSCRAVPSGK